MGGASTDIQKDGRGCGTGSNHVHAGPLRHENPEALNRLVASDVKVAVFPLQVLEAIHSAAEELYAELIAKNEDFAKLYRSQKQFRDQNYLYHQFADFQYDTMMLQLRRKT